MSERLRNQLEEKSGGKPTPEIGETLAIFFTRTSNVWESIIRLKEENVKGKALRKEAFELAQKHFDQMKPILDEIVKEAEQEKEKEEAETEDKKSKGIPIKRKDRMR